MTAHDPSSAARWPRVAVVGGSIGGLTAALVLRDLGCDVVVHERSPSAPEGRGVGIVLHDMTVRYLAEDDGPTEDGDPTEHGAPRGRLDLEAVSTSARYLRYLDRDGHVVYEGERNYHFTAYGTLYRALLARLDPDRYHLGHEVVEFAQQGEEVTYRLADGSVGTCDLLVCADGVSSPSRRRLHPDVRPRYAGYVGWRGVLEERALSRATTEALHDAITYAVAPHSHILVYPIPHYNGSREPGRRLVNVVWYRNVRTGQELDNLLTDTRGQRRESSVPPGLVRGEAVDELRTAAAREFPRPIAEVVAKAEEPFIQVIVDIAVPRMAVGRVCLIGDAAFAVRPHAAAATAKAAADGWALAESLEKSDGDVPTALGAWEPRQRALGHRLLERTREMGDRSQVAGTWEAGHASLDFGLDGPGR
ncbi:MAG: FAD-dependent monooxygenase [Actinomycetes bacterium]